MKNTWLFPLIEAVHLIGLTLFVGTLSLRNFYLLGWVEEINLRRWTRAGLALVLTTGPLMLLSDPSRYLHNRAFLIKMAILTVAALSQGRLGRSKQAAWISLLLWSAVVIGGRAIADFDA